MKTEIQFIPLIKLNIQYTSSSGVENQHTCESKCAQKEKTVLTAVAIVVCALPV